MHKHLNYLLPTALLGTTILLNGCLEEETAAPKPEIVKEAVEVVIKTDDEILAELKSSNMMPWFRRTNERSVAALDVSSLNLPSSGSLPDMLNALDSRAGKMTNGTASKQSNMAYFDMNRDYAFALLIGYFDEGVVAQHNLRVDFTADADGVVKPYVAGEYWKCRDITTGKTSDSSEPCV